MIQENKATTPSCFPRYLRNCLAEQMKSHTENWIKSRIFIAALEELELGKNPNDINTSCQNQNIMIKSVAYIAPLTLNLT